MKFSDKQKYFLHNEGNAAIRLNVEVGGEHVQITDALTEETAHISYENGQITLNIRPGQAVFMERAQGKAKPQTPEKVREIPFEKTDEDDTSITYSVRAELYGGERIKIEYSGEFARVKIGETEQDFIGRRAVLHCVDNAQNATVKIYKNLAETMHDDLSKWDILRPAELKSICIIGKCSYGI